MAIDPNDARTYPAYRNHMSPRQKAILQAMPAPSAELRAYYVNMIKTRSTINPAPGVLINPRSCQIDQTQQLINTIIDTINVDWGTAITNAAVDPNDWQIHEDAWNDYGPGLIDNLNTATDQLNQFQNWTDNQVANLDSSVGAAQDYMGMIANLMNALNPCIPFSEFFASLMEEGAAMLNNLIGMLQGVLNMVQAAIQQVMQMIQQMMQEIMGMITNMMNMIADEINKLADALMGGLMSMLAGLLDWLPNDPCLKALIGAVVGGGIGALLGGASGAGQGAAAGSQFFGGSGCNAPGSASSALGSLMPKMPQLPDPSSLLPQIPSINMPQFPSLGSGSNKSGGGNCGGTGGAA